MDESKIVLVSHLPVKKRSCSSVVQRPCVLPCFWAVVVFLDLEVGFKELESNCIQNNSGYETCEDLNKFHLPFHRFCLPKTGRVRSSRAARTNAHSTAQNFGSTTRGSGAQEDALNLQFHCLTFVGDSYLQVAGN